METVPGREKVSRCLSVVLLLTTLLLSACGYSNPAFRGSDTAPATHTLHIPLWMNRTNELGLETTFRHTLNRWFRQASKIRLVAGPQGADLVLDGEILTISLPGESFQQHDQAQEVSATVTIRYTLRNGHDNSIIWQEDGRTRNESYRLVPDSARTLGNRQQALNTLANELAERIYQRTLDTIGRM